MLENIKLNKDNQKFHNQNQNKNKNNSSILNQNEIIIDIKEKEKENQIENNDSEGKKTADQSKNTITQINVSINKQDSYQKKHQDKLNEIIIIIMEQIFINSP